MPEANDITTLSFYFNTSFILSDLKTKNRINRKKHKFSFHFFKNRIMIHLKFKTFSGVIKNFRKN